jgi:fatty acid desaturase
MDDEVYRSELLNRATLRDLSRRSDGPGLLHFGAHLTLIAALVALAVSLRGTWWQIPALWAQGVALVFLFAPLHETIHRTAFKRRWLNDAVAWICGAVLMLPPEYFRAFHFAHHRHTQDPMRDPELATPKPRSLGGWLRQLSGLPYWMAEIKVTLRHALGRVTESFIPARSKARVVTEARILWAVYLVLTVGSVALRTDALLLYGVLPLLLGQPALRAYLMAEHTGCASGPDMLVNSRTTTTNALIRFLAWNMPFHAEHHGWPALPFHALPAAHRLVKQGLRCRGNGYVSVGRNILFPRRETQRQVESVH